MLRASRKTHLVLNPAVPYLILPVTALGCFSMPTLDAFENILYRPQDFVKTANVCNLCADVLKDLKSADAAF